MKHKILIGINYIPVGQSDEVRREPGDEATDIPPADAAWLIEQRCIELIETEPPADAPPAAKPKRARKGKEE
jgi:hypothetical protein